MKCYNCGCTPETNPNMVHAKNGWVCSDCVSEKDIDDIPDFAIKLAKLINPEYMEGITNVHGI